MSTRAETNRINSVPMKGYGTTTEKIEEINSMQGKKPHQEFDLMCTVLYTVLYTLNRFGKLKFKKHHDFYYDYLLV